MSTSKVFLCHASSDKSYVDHVAEKLGRTRVAYDKLDFRLGQDFKSEIERCLDGSSLFVFFASNASLKSYWCNFELSVADKLQLKGALEGALAIIVDRIVDFADLPRWLSDVKSVRIPAPSAAVREIEAALFAIKPPDHQRSYVMRTAVQQRLQETVSQVGVDRPRMIVLGGLEGIGRRSFLQNAAQNVFGMRFGPVIHVDDTLGLEDVYLALLDETAVPQTVKSLAAELAAFRALPVVDACSEIANRVEILCELNHFPCFVDNGGLLDEKGDYKTPFVAVFQQCLSRPICHFGVSHRRRPNLQNTPFERQALFQFIGPLNQAESMLLLTQLLRRRGANCDSAELKDVIYSLGGYPPAIQVAANYIAEYGLDVLMNEAYVLVDFTSRRFLPFLQRLQVSDHEVAIMQYLACERTMTLDVIRTALDLPPEATALALKRLIDLNIAIHEDNRYAISGPLRDSIIRLKGYLSVDIYTVICQRLSMTYWSGSDNSAPSIDAIDATLHAALIGQMHHTAPYVALVRASTVHRLAKEAYFQNNFSSAEAYARKAIEMEPSRWLVLTILVKSLIQLERYNDIEPYLVQIGEVSKKTEHYLRGFEAKKRYHTKKAIDEFEKAIAHGDDSISVHRDLAESLYRDGRIKEAVDRIEKARMRMRDNPYVLDLAIKIYIDANEQDKADSCLSDLEKCDVQERFIHHCKARLLSSKGDYEKALGSADRACQMQSPPFEVFAKRIDILMHLNRFPQAWSDLEVLEGRFPRHRRDILRGLRCKWYALQGNWSKAQMSWDDIVEKKTNAVQGLRRMIFEVKANDSTLTLSERQEAREMAQAVSVPSDRADLTIVDGEADIEL